jgi:hypothetical protein
VIGAAAMFVVAIGASGTAGLVAIRQVNMFTRSQARAEVVETAARAPRTLPPERVASLAAPLRDDPDLMQRLRAVRGNPEYGDVARINALLLENALATSRSPRNRWYIKGIDWAGGTLRAAQLSAITFQEGTVRQVRFEDTHFGGVIWNDASQVRLSGLRFVRSRFDGGGFFGTLGIDLEFVNSHFTGTRLDLEHFSHTRFRSEVADPRPGLITDEVGSIVNSVIERCVPPAPDGVLVIDPPGSGVDFEGMVFENVRFRGRIPPAWFRGCSFIDCILPRTLTQSVLEQGRNSVSGAVWVDDDCGAAPSDP